MLIQFVVENFRSFRDKAVLSMRAVGTDAEERAGIYMSAGQERALRAAAIYGPNASGKSNLVDAIDFARFLILEGTSAKERISHQPFKLDPSYRRRPSRFEFVFVHENIQYAYGFLVDAKRVHAEWLYQGPEDREELLFQRELEEASGTYEFELGEALSSEPRRRQFYEFLHEGTRPNQLFLREAEERNATELDPPVAWFRERLSVISPDAKFALLASLVDESAEFRDFLGELLERADTSIEKILVKRSKHPVPELSDEEKERLEVLRKKGMRFSGSEYWEELIANQQGDIEIERSRLVTRHGASVDDVVFELSEESDGTRRVMHLAPMLYHAGGEEGHVFVVDELERSLHPLLTLFFMREFLGGPVHTNQLICTTHDVNLLDVDLLAPEAIWFVEKDRAGGSHAYSLDEFDEEQLQALQGHKRRGYLQGRFGAIPFLGDTRRLLPDEPKE